uniref:NUCB1-like N-terminal domain-containing protein n=1 Tax=Ciona savignyi TaxID=51511 RepID=H2YER2_CIOSA
RKVQKSAYLKQIADHLDHSSPHTFEAEDLTKLIKTATSDLENYDRDRHEEFKKFEMRKEMQREEKLKKLDEQERIKAQEEYRKQQEEQAQKSKIHHPVSSNIEISELSRTFCSLGSRQQLDDVWENEDGLKDEEFNPKTFFYMHGHLIMHVVLISAMQGSKAQLEDVWNEERRSAGTGLEAIFEKDLEKIYPDGTDENVMQMEEERTRMREHVMKEVDTNNDGLITLKEFLRYSDSPEFAAPDETSYKVRVYPPTPYNLYTQDELRRYRESISDQEEEIKAKLEILKSQAKELGGMRRELGDHRRD